MQIITTPHYTIHQGLSYYCNDEVHNDGERWKIVPASAMWIMKICLVGDVKDRSKIVDLQNHISNTSRSACYFIENFEQNKFALMDIHSQIIH